MITKTDIHVDLIALQQHYYENIDNWPNFENRICLNNYTGADDYEKNASLRMIYTEFPYMNSIFKNTVWEDTLKLLPGKIGRARLMFMNPRASLSKHRDFEARWQLAIFTDPRCTIYDCDNDQNYHIPADGYFYKLDARQYHAAYNNTDDFIRVSLVVAEYV